MDKSLMGQGIKKTTAPMTELKQKCFNNWFIQRSRVLRHLVPPFKDLIFKELSNMKLFTYAACPMKILLNFRIQGNTFNVIRSWWVRISLEPKKAARWSLWLRPKQS